MFYRVVHESLHLCDSLCLLLTYLPANYRLLTSITSFRSCALHYYLIKVCVGSMSLQKLSVFIVYLLEDDKELSLGMLDTSQTYL